MSKMNVKQLLKTNAPIILLLVIFSGVSAAYIQRFQLNRNAVIKVTENPYQAELYSDKTCTTPLTVLDFGVAIIGDPNNDGTLTAEEFYVYLPMLEPGDSAYGRWMCDDVPDGMSLTGYYDNNFVGEMFPWGENVNTGEITVSDNLFRVKFRLDYGDNGVGVYEFTITLSLGVVT